MATATLVDRTGKAVGQVELPPPFGAKPHTAAIYEALEAALRNRRAGTAATKTRGEVRGGGRKPWRQKGTGRARAGSTRSPLWVGGGVVFGPQPRDYSARLPQKVRRLALRSALSAKAASGAVTVVADLGLESGKTKDLAAFLDALVPQGRVAVITAAVDARLVRAARNIPGVAVLAAAALNLKDLLVADHLVVAREALPRLEEALS